MILQCRSAEKLQVATLAELAKIAHDAEDEGDDIIAFGIMQELESRGSNALNIFQELYQSEWRKRIGCK